MSLYAALLGVVALVGVAATTATGAMDATSAAISSPSPAHTLAALDCRCVPSSTLVMRYQRILSKLGKKCEESQARLAYISTQATLILRQNGHRRTNLWLLTRVDQSVTPKPPNPAGFKRSCRYRVAEIVNSIVA